MECRCLFDRCVDPVVNSHLICAFDGGSYRMFLGELLISKGDSNSKLTPGAIASVHSIIGLVLGATRGRKRLSLYGPRLYPIGPIEGPLQVLSLGRRRALRSCLLRGLARGGVKALVTLCAKMQLKRLYTVR